jgi:hypothetical protein
MRMDRSRRCRSRRAAGPGEAPTRSDNSACVCTEASERGIRKRAHVARLAGERRDVTTAQVQFLAAGQAPGPPDHSGVHAAHPESRRVLAAVDAQPDGAGEPNAGEDRPQPRARWPRQGGQAIADAPKAADDDLPCSACGPDLVCVRTWMPSRRARGQFWSCPRLSQISGGGYPARSCTSRPPANVISIFARAISAAGCANRFRSRTTRSAALPISTDPLTSSEWLA